MTKSARAKSFKVIISNDLAEPILTSSLTLVLIGLEVKSYKDQPKLEELRNHLIPAYTAIAMILAQQCEGRSFTINNLHGLNVELLATQGYFKFSVMYTEDNKTETFNVTVYPKDGKTILIRSYTRPIRDASKSKEELIDEEIRML